MQASGMASYRIRPTAKPSPRSDNTDVASLPRVTSTRLPTRKQMSKQPQPAASTTQSPSKLTKKRTSYAGNNEHAGRIPSTRDEANTRIAQVNVSKGQVQNVPVAAPLNSKRALSQPRTLLPSSIRNASLESASARTPSLVSGSSTSTVDSQKSHLLRRKPSSIGKSVSRLRKSSVTSQDGAAVVDTLDVLVDPFPDSVLGEVLPIGTTEILPKEQHGIPIPPPLQHEGYMSYAQTFAEMPAPPTPLYMLSSTPSTGYSGSPGPFSIASTPTSMSSYSPATTVTSKAPSGIVQQSPVKSRPPVTRRRIDESEDRALSSVRESSASSSGSTARASVIGAKSTPVRGDSLSSRPRTSHDRKADRVIDDSRPKTAMPPPELAHLVDAKPLQQFAPGPKPSRPSREGTPDFYGFRDPSPVVQSNLQSLPSASHRRQGSSESREGGASSAPISSRLRMVPPLRLPSRNPSPSPSRMSMISPTTSKMPQARGPTPDHTSDSESRAKKGIVPSASPAKSGSRFGFFRRKTEPTPPPSTSTEKRPRKGPAAGTGHEGYGRYGLPRGRSGSTTSGGSSGGRSPSADSGTGSAQRAAPSRKSSTASKGAPEMDEFLRDRLAPVPLRGEGPVASDHRQDTHSATPRTSNGDYIVAPQPFAAPVSSPTESASVLAPQKPILKPTPSVQPPRSSSPIKRGHTAPSDPQSSSKFGFRSLGGKRNSRIATHLESKASHAVPVNSQAMPGLTNITTVSSNVPQPAQILPQEDVSTKSAVQPVSKQPGKLTRKWNFFQRSQAVPVKETPSLEPSPDIYQSSARPLPHYALEEQRNKIDMDELEQIFQEANESPDELEPAETMPELDLDTILGRRESGIAPNELLASQSDAFEEISEEPQSSRAAHVRSMLLPDRPLLPPPGLEQFNRPASPKVQLQRDSLDRAAPPASTKSNSIQDAVLDQVDTINESPISPLVPMPPQRQPRLQQVGRIPQVKRDRERKLSVHSFSRPFGADGSPAVQQQTPPTGSESPQLLPHEAPSAPLLNDMVAQLRMSSFVEDVEAALESKRHSSQTATTIDATAADDIAGFLTFPPRKDSDYSMSTSSGHPSFKAPLATAPVISLPTITSTEDEVWNEYDEFIDEVLSSPGPSGPPSGRKPAPLKLFNGRLPGSDSGSTLQPRLPAETRDTLSAHNSLAVHSNPSLPPILTPKSPYSVTDILAAYGARGLSICTVDTNVQSVPTTSAQFGIPYPSQSASVQPLKLSHSSANLSRAADAQVAQRSHVALQHEIEDTSDCETSSSYEDEEDGPASMANLRFGALMTSKWLSFGRVLFSPAHNELKDPHEDRVLVVDGLGKDWSHYVALTYQNASVYSLGPDPSAFPSTRPNTSGATIEEMPNHRHIHHPHLNAPFPFPKGFFAAVVFRFPAIASESAYRMALAESKRVLRPGGYLEVSLLDMDPINMGSKARKAVKTLKMHLADQHPEWSLKPMSDVVMKLIGRRGFENIQRCALGVPASGPIKRSGDAAGSFVPSTSTPESSSFAPLSADSGSDTPSKTTMSFTELLRSSQDGADTSGISRMVCKVGRWWYERCYEAPSFKDSSLLDQQSIWGDDALLNECERLNTTFRLLICCAQKPTGVVRRTVSV